jgi:hypothetical protein
VTKATLSTSDAVAETLARYAERGVFQSFSRQSAARGKTTFQIVWHRGRAFELVFDSKRGTLRLTELLPQVPAAMYKALKAFIEARQTDDLPEHRRIDRARVEVRSSHRAGSVSLSMTAVDGDCQYAVTKFVHLVNEIYLIFLAEGEHFDYLVETFDLDPDRM